MQRQPCGPGTRPAPSGAAWAHPNELDWRRIQRSLQQRLRYRYVSPIVESEPGGYRIVSPCCSRNIDPGGGPIDIARLVYEPQRNTWRLCSKNHATEVWELQAEGRLHELLALLNQDPQRVFWQ